MWLELVLFAARWSFLHLFVGICMVAVFGVLIGWLYSWIMDDSR